MCMCYIYNDGTVHDSEKKATRAARGREAEVVWWFHISPPFVSVFTKHLLTILECHAKTRLLCAC